MRAVGWVALTVEAGLLVWVLWRRWRDRTIRR